MPCWCFIDIKQCIGIAITLFSKYWFIKQAANFSVYLSSYRAGFKWMEILTNIFSLVTIFYRKDGMKKKQDDLPTLGFEPGPFESLEKWCQLYLLISNLTDTFFNLTDKQVWSIFLGKMFYRSSTNPASNENDKNSSSTFLWAVVVGVEHMPQDIEVVGSNPVGCWAIFCHSPSP